MAWRGDLREAPDDVRQKVPAKTADPMLIPAESCVELNGPLADHSFHLTLDSSLASSIPLRCKLFAGNSTSSFFNSAPSLRPLRAEHHRPANFLCTEARLHRAEGKARSILQLLVGQHLASYLIGTKCPPAIRHEGHFAHGWWLDHFSLPFWRS